jgi:hypothetical protein
MAADGSITRLIVLLEEGDRAAAEPLWNAYFQRLVGLARTRLRGTPPVMADEEDVALSAFHSVCRRAEAGLFPRLDDRDDLWQLLFVLTARKAIALVRYQSRARRGARRVVSLEDLAAWDLDAVLGHEPTPSSPRRWLRSTGGCSTVWVTSRSEPLPDGR